MLLLPIGVVVGVEVPPPLVVARIAIVALAVDVIAVVAIFSNVLLTIIVVVGTVVIGIESIIRLCVVVL